MIRRWMIFSCLALGMSALQAQQIPTSFQAAHVPELYNPAAYGATGQHALYMQSRQLNQVQPGLPMFNRLAAYSSPALGRYKNKGWGALIQSRRDNMEFYHNVRIGMAVQVVHKAWRSRRGDALNTTTLRIAVGGFGGLHGGGANYSPLVRADDFDPTLQRRPTAWEPDAGIGMDLRYTRNGLRAGISAHAAHLPAMTRVEITGSRIGHVPHLLLQSSFALTVQNDLEIGPAAMYVRAARDTNINHRSRLDLHLRANFTRHRFWLVAGLQIQQPFPATVVGGGICLLQPEARQTQHRMELNFYLAMPRGLTKFWGTRSEIGLKWQFGTAREKLRPHKMVRL